MNPFIHLRVHTAYSLLEGAVFVKKIPDLCKKHNMPAVAITDTNNLFGALEISMLLADYGIQPIIGCQLSVQTSDEHISPTILLAQTSEGYTNLLRLVSEFYLQSQKGAPLTDICDRSDGLIIFAGASNRGLLSLPSAENTLDQLQKTFGDRLYIELQRHPSPISDEKRLLNDAIKRHIPIVATNDVYFSEANMFQAHDALLCIAGGAYVDQPDRRRVTPHHYWKSTEEMRSLFHDIEEAIEHTSIIAKRCSFRPTPKAPMLPHYCEGEDEELANQAHTGLLKRLENEVYIRFQPEEYEEQKKIYTDRLDYELSVIKNMGFSGYFLIVSDFIKWAKQHGIPVGPGRGSGAGSLVAWSTLITDMDPLRFQLIFERFLNPERVSMPDFDVDFCQDRRDEVIQYVSKRYGADHVAHIITFGSLQARSTLRDVGRVLQMPYNQVDRLAKCVPAHPGQVITLSDALKSETALQEQYNEDDMVRHLFDVAMQLEGLYRHASTHAAGVVIGNKPLYEIVPLYVDDKSTLPATQFSMKYVEAAGLVKFDFLGLKTLTIIEDSCKLIRKKKPIQILEISLEDQKTFDLLGRVETVGIFQLESGGMRDVLRKLKPDRFEDLIALVALYRPGPMDDIPRYLNCKHGNESVHYAHPAIESILSPTYGVMVYQEQVMQIAQTLAGYSLGSADLLRRAMGKKIKSEMDDQREMFVQGAVKNNVNLKVAESIFDQMAKFAGYGFNKSHASPYALLAYQTAYLKAHYPLEFFAANMTADMQHVEKVEVFKRDMERMGLKLLPPCVNQSQAQFSVEGDAVRFGLSAIKNVGISPMESLVSEREARGPFKNLDDFVKRSDPKILHKRCLEMLIASGALDALHPNRRALWDGQDHLQPFKEQHQRTLFEPKITLPPVAPWGQLETLQKEFDALGFYLSGHPLDAYGITYRNDQLEDLAHTTESITRSLPALITARQDRRSKAGQRFAFITLSDRSGSFEAAAFSDTLSQYDEVLHVGAAIQVEIFARVYGEGDSKSIRLMIQKVDHLSGQSLQKKNLHIDLEKFASQNTQIEDLPSISQPIAEDEAFRITIGLRGKTIMGLEVPEAYRPHIETLTK